MKCACIAAGAVLLVAGPISAQATPLTIGETMVLHSKELGEQRRINVYTPPGYSDSTAARLPVLYMPDGGIAEDFLHIAGLVQVSVGNSTMRPFILVGIENTQRRRDMTGPTDNAEDRKIAPQVGGSAKFRSFIRNELMPVINERYHTTSESAIVGESLAGLLVVETYILEPDLFDTYIAFDPSLWWNDGHLLKLAQQRSSTSAAQASTLYIASSNEKEIADLSQKLFDIIVQQTGANQKTQYMPMPGETHGTIYHPAALMAFRQLFKPAPLPR